MDQFPVEINIDDYWNSQIHALVIFHYTSSVLPFTI